MPAGSTALTFCRTIRTAAVLLALSALPVPTLSQAGLPAAQPSEYDVKAAFLLNFIKFIEWPARPEEANAPFPICILGEDPFDSTLDQIVTGESVGGRHVIVQRIDQLQPSCRVVFIGEFVKEPAKTIANAGHGILTVGEGEEFVRKGGMIGFVVVNRRVRFDINHKAATNAALRVSSRLLSVARAVIK
jgi:hypothetical protein